MNNNTNNTLTEQENDFLECLKQYHFLPVARFVLKSSKEHDFISVTLPCVYIYDLHQTIEQVKSMSSLITSLENKRYITTDYDMPLKNYPYDEYFNSDIYAHFKNTVEESKNKEGFLGDIADIECGSIALIEE